MMSNSVKDERTKALVFLVMTAALWSMGGLLIKLISWNPIAIAGMRSAIAAVVFLVVFRKIKLTWSLWQILGAVAYSANVILFVVSSKMTTAANAILLQYTAPIYIALFGAWFLKEKTTLRDWITIFIVICGMVLFFVDDISAGGLYGNILAVLSGFFFALMILLLRKQKDSSTIESIFLGNVITAIVSLPFMFQSMPDAKSSIGLLLLGVFQLGIPYVLYSVAIKHVTAIEGVLIPVIEPILNPVWVFIAIGEFPGIWAVIGGLIVLSAITLNCVFSAVKTNRQKISC